MDAASDRKHWVVLGQVGRPHGLHGALRVRWYDPPAALTAPLTEVRLRLANAQASAYAVLDVRPTDADVGLLQLAGLTSPEAAGRWRGAELAVPRALLPPAADDEVYLFELLGLQVYDVAKNHLGRASRLYDHGAGAILGILPPGPGGEVAPSAPAKGAAALAATEAGERPRPKRGQRRRKRGEAAAQELLVPLLPKVLRDVDVEAGRAIIDLAHAHMEQA